MMRIIHFLTGVCYIPGYSGGPSPDESTFDKTIDECFFDCVEHDECNLATFTENFDGTQECKFYNTPESIVSVGDKKSISMDFYCAAGGSGEIPIYRKTPKILDSRKFAVITQKVEQDGFSLE